MPRRQRRRARGYPFRRNSLVEVQQRDGLADAAVGALVGLRGVRAPLCSFFSRICLDSSLCIGSGRRSGSGSGLGLGLGRLSVGLRRGRRDAEARGRLESNRGSIGIYMDL